MVVLAILATSVFVGAKKTAEPAKSPPPAGARGHAKEVESVIEEVTAKQLERVLNEKDYVAVFWCKWSSRAMIYLRYKF